MAAVPSTSSYVVAGRDLKRFVTAWLDDLESGGGQMRGLLATAAETGEPDGEYLYNASFLMANIGPRAAEEAASPEELLLCGVLSLYQMDHQLYRGMEWDSARAHVRRAFKYAHEIGDATAARKLIHAVIERMDPGPPSYEEMRRKDRLKNPGKAAAHEQRMADLDQRNLKAAELFDPAADFDTQLLQQRPSALKRQARTVSRAPWQSYDSAKAVTTAQGSNPLSCALS